MTRVDVQPSEDALFPDSQTYTARRSSMAVPHDQHRHPRRQKLQMEQERGDFDEREHQNRVVV
jgi:hypothetical protein